MKIVVEANSLNMWFEKKPKYKRSTTVEILANKNRLQRHQLREGAKDDYRIGMSLIKHSQFCENYEKTKEVDDIPQLPFIENISEDEEEEESDQENKEKKQEWDKSIKLGRKYRKVVQEGDVKVFTENHGHECKGCL